MLSLLDWYPEPDRDLPRPEEFDEHHVAFIEMDGRDVEVTGYFVHAEPAVNAPCGWRIELAEFYATGEDASEALFQDAAAMRRAENALDVARARWSS